jgi:hypothetical protein
VPANISEGKAFTNLYKLQVQRSTVKWFCRKLYILIKECFAEVLNKQAEGYANETITIQPHKFINVT